MYKKIERFQNQLSIIMNGYSDFLVQQSEANKSKPAY